MSERAHSLVREGRRAAGGGGRGGAARRAARREGRTRVGRERAGRAACARARAEVEYGAGRAQAAAGPSPDVARPAGAVLRAGRAGWRHRVGGARGTGDAIAQPVHVRRAGGAVGGAVERRDGAGRARHAHRDGPLGRGVRAGRVGAVGEAAGDADCDSRVAHVLRIKGDQGRRQARSREEVAIQATVRRNACQQRPRRAGLHARTAAAAPIATRARQEGCQRVGWHRGRGPVGSSAGPGCLE